MALSDIKDAGALAGFVRWGWPYHGLCTGTTIAGSGKTIPQPINGNTWLIDRALPALDISPAEVTAEAAEGREWWNYALISGGVIYGKRLPTASDSFGSYPTGYIHFDESDIPWMVTLAFSFPSTNTVRVTASIVRFGLFDQDVGPMTPITKTADAACEGVEVTSGYYGRQVRLHDVYTNGSKALACVEHFFQPVSGFPEISVMSAINVTFTGSGGSDGSGLTMAADETVPRSVLTYGGSLPTIAAWQVSTGVYGAALSVSCTPVDPACPGGISQTCTGTPDMGVEAKWNLFSTSVVSQGSDFTVTRICYYDSAGDVVSLKYRTANTTLGNITVTDGPRMIVSSTDYVCGDDWTAPIELMVELTLVSEKTIGHYILRNDTIIDRVEYKKTTTQTQEQRAFVSNRTITDDVDNSAAATWAGSVTSGFPTTSAPPARYLQPGLTSANPNFYFGGQFYVTPDIAVGIYRSGRSAAFYRDNNSSGVWSYGTVVTPAGSKTTSLTAPFYFSHQRKTDDFSFSLSPICYV